ncbi:MAG: hypothetical protein LBH74_05495 [Nitrososphaerota archaeon]|nr:hypothetical protein [Nitrososphaerota archaeon]
MLRRVPKILRYTIPSRSARSATLFAASNPSTTTKLNQCPKPRRTFKAKRL